MKNINPYTLMFGKEPNQLISRTVQAVEILENFLAETPSQQIYMIGGVRGSGKTVFMTDVADRLSQEKDWIVLELNPEKDLLLGFAAKLYDNKALHPHLKAAKINLSAFGIGVEISDGQPISDIEVAISRMLEHAKKQHKKVLVTIDEVSNTKEMRIFAHSFQLFVRQDLPLFLLMTGLYENIDALQNENTLTFLYRAPKLQLKPLNYGNIMENYQKSFSIDEETAREMAWTTKGYPFAFQVLGYYTWEQKGDYRAAIPMFRQYLDEYVYDKMWTGLSHGDKKVLYGIASISTGKISEIRELLKMASNEFSPYKDRLLRRGLISNEERGYVRFTLPLFDEYIKNHYYGEG